MKRQILFLPLVLFVITLRIRAGEVSVFAAASLTDSLKEIAATYEKSTGDKIIFNFAASSLLERQIEEGAPADVFFSADEAKMDALQKKGLIATETRKSRLSNMLVIVIRADSTLNIKSPEDLANPVVRRIALADPKAVPAGIYAKEFLEQRKLWPAVEGKVVPTENVRAALAAVESGNIEAGIVYKSDAGISKNVRVAYAILPRKGPPISYPVAVVKDAKNADAARKFVEYLDSTNTVPAFEKYGFTVIQ